MSKSNKESKIALYLDDVRVPIEKLPDTQWVIVKDYNEFTKFLLGYYRENKVLPELISLDHDLADEHMDYYMKHSVGQDPIDYLGFKEKTGLHCAKWLTEFCQKNKIDLRNTKLVVHSHNPVGTNNIVRWLNHYLKTTYGPEDAIAFAHKFKFKIEEDNDY